VLVLKEFEHGLSDSKDRTILKSIKDIHARGTFEPLIPKVITTSDWSFEVQRGEHCPLALAWPNPSIWVSGMTFTSPGRETVWEQNRANR
jgi:hypothetical protein